MQPRRAVPFADTLDGRCSSATETYLQMKVHCIYSRKNLYMVVIYATDGRTDGRRNEHLSSSCLNAHCHSEWSLE